MKKQITFYFSFCEIVEGKTDEEIIQKAEKLCEAELTEKCWDYNDETITEDLEQEELEEKYREYLKNIVLGDNSFNIIKTKDFETWTKDEEKQNKDNNYNEVQ